MRWKEASTVIIAAKNKTNEQFQILSLQRSEKSSFLPNVHVFPGGLCDDADSSIEWLKVFKFQNLINLDKIEFNMINPIGTNHHIYNLPYNNYKDNKQYISIDYLKQIGCIQPNNINQSDPREDNINIENKILPKFISLRITAIRETFEECGILLCKPNKKDENIKISKSQFNNNTLNNNSNIQSTQCYSTTNQQNEDSLDDSVDQSSSNYMKNYFNFEQLSDWRKKIYNNPMEFINLCLLLDCHPDLNNVKIWSNWLSPGNQYFPSRYDSKFFLVMFNDDDIPKCDIDYYEMKSLQWCSPEQLIKDSMSGKLWLPPPQFYECSRLLNFKSISHLNSFLSNHNSKFCEQWIPVRIKAKDGEIGILPGDWMYPLNGFDINSTDYYKDCSEYSMIELQNTCDDQVQNQQQEEDYIRRSNLPLHRMQYSGPFRIELVVNNLPKTFHSIPISQNKNLYKKNCTESKL